MFEYITKSVSLVYYFNEENSLYFVGQMEQIYISLKRDKNSGVIQLVFNGP